MKTLSTLSGFALFLCAIYPLKLSAAEKRALRVGAARVDITPAADAALPMAGYANRKDGFKAIHDHIFAR